MTFRAFVDQIYERTKTKVPMEFLEWETIRAYANYGLSWVFPRAILAMPEFYQTSQSFTATSNTVPKPSDCHKILHVEVFGTAIGASTPVDVRQWDTVANDAIQKGTASNPKYREDADSIFLDPHQDALAVNFTGKFHYLRNFGQISDDTFEISEPNVDALPAIPWIYEEDALMEAVRQIKLRAKAAQDKPSTVESFIQNVDESMKRLEAGKDPYAIYRTSLPGTPQ